MKIDKDRARKAFEDYVEHYDSKDEKIKLKIDHTYRVSELSEKIAEYIGLTREDIDLAWLIGLLHDVGRFEQLRRFGTFNDAKSIDHAKCGTHILFEQGRIRDYIDDTSEDELIETAIACHNVYRVPKELPKRTLEFCNIIRDADKIDIFKVNSDVSFEEIYNIELEELCTAVVSEEVMDSFKEEHAVLHKLKKTPVDKVVGHISLAYELVYPISTRLVSEQGYLEQMMNFNSNNPITIKQFKEIRTRMHVYLSRRIG